MNLECTKLEIRVGGWRALDGSALCWLTPSRSVWTISEQVGGEAEVRIGGVFGDRQSRGTGVDVDGLGAHQDRCLSVFAQHIESIQQCRAPRRSEGQERQASRFSVSPDLKGVRSVLASEDCGLI